MVINRLFVYGTLQPEQKNHYILKNVGGEFVKATLFGYQFNKKWELKTTYPGLTKSSTFNKVEGYLFTSKNLSHYLPVIDAFETNAYVREIVSITLNNNSKVDAYVYLINSDFNLNYF